MGSLVGVGHKRGTNNDKDVSAIKRAMDLSEDLSAKIKKTKDKVAGILNKPQAAGTSKRQEPWCRLISQYSMVRLLLCPFTSPSISRTDPGPLVLWMRP
jgi:hypothetical protein